jgi:hypothetical protein
LARVRSSAFSAVMAMSFLWSDGRFRTVADELRQRLVRNDDQRFRHRVKKLVKQKPVEKTE